MSLTPTFIYKAVVNKIVDADTVDLTLDLGLRVTTHIRVRLLGINAPEMNTPEGKAAKAALLTFMPVGSTVIARTFKDPTDKYGRWIASLEHLNVDVSKWLVVNEHAVEKEY